MQVNLFALFLGNITGTASVYLREIITTPSFFFWKQTDSCSSFTVSVCWSMVTTHPEYTLRTTLIFAFSPRLTSSSRRSTAFWLSAISACVFILARRSSVLRESFDTSIPFCAATSSNCFSPVVIFLITSPFSSMDFCRSDSSCHRNFKRKAFPEKACQRRSKRLLLLW